MRAREQDLDLDAAACGGAQQLDEERIRREVGGGQPNPFLRRLDHHAQQCLHVLPAETGRASHHLHDGFALRGVVDEPVAVIEEFVMALGPVLGESGGQPVHGGTAHLHVGVAPFVRSAGVAAPLLGDTDPAGERGLLIDDQDLAVTAVILLQR